MDLNSIKDLLYRIGDDDLITGHRNSEWTGLGPILEEDIAFSSMAQDEIGHAQAYYMILHEFFDEPHMDVIGFQRKPNEFRSCHLVEMPNQDYAFSLVRHALYDTAEAIRLQHLGNSAFKPLAELARKLAREEKYHSLHAQTWIKQLGNATAESNARLQAALDQAYPLALGIFEPTEFSDQLAADGVMSPEAELEAEWKSQVSDLFVSSGLRIPEVADPKIGYGGRKGNHTEHLAPLLEEMTQVFAIDPVAKW